MSIHGSISNTIAYRNKKKQEHSAGAYLRHTTMCSVIESDQSRSNDE